jgi:hypothetical protein
MFLSTLFVEIWTHFFKTPFLTFNVSDMIFFIYILMSIVIVDDAKIVEFAPQEAAYLQLPNFTPKPNNHFLVRKSTPRQARPKDSLSTSTDLRSSTTTPRSVLASSSGMSGTSSNILSTSTHLSSGGGTSILSSSSGASKVSSSSILGQTSRFEGRRSYVSSTATSGNDLTFVDSITEAKAKQDKLDEEARQKVAKKAAKVEKREKSAEQKKKASEEKDENKGVLALVAGLKAGSGGHVSNKKRKTVESNQQETIHQLSPIIPSNHGLGVINNDTSSLHSLLFAVGRETSSEEHRPISSDPSLQITSTSSLPIYSQAPPPPMTSFNAAKHHLSTQLDVKSSNPPSQIPTHTIIPSSSSSSSSSSSLSSTTTSSGTVADAEEVLLGMAKVAAERASHPILPSAPAPMTSMSSTTTTIGGASGSGGLAGFRVGGIVGPSPAPSFASNSSGLTFSQLPSYPSYSGGIGTTGFAPSVMPALPGGLVASSSSSSSAHAPLFPSTATNHPNNLTSNLPTFPKTPTAPFFTLPQQPPTLLQQPPSLTQQQQQPETGK